VEDLRARLRDWMESFDAAAIDFGAVFRAVGRLFDVGGGLLTGALGWASYLLIAAVVVVFCFFFFVWKWDALVTWFLPYIPASRRARVVEVVGKMDASVSAFIRGRLVQSVVVAIVLSVGWAVTDVPYWLLLGLAGAALNLVPYAAMAVWPVAVLLATVDGYAENDFSLWWDVIGASVVYLIAQSLDAYVVEPVVQGKATNLDPLTVLLVVLVGGSLAGLMGMLLAIPIAACVRIVARELVLPKMRQWAAEH
jgi:predicted PurR-regulated permease PerM